MSGDRAADLRAEILGRVGELVRLRGAQRPFVPGQTPVPYAGRVYDEDEVLAGVDSLLDFWLTLGPEGAAFETELAALLGMRLSVLVNSGSSANLLAVSALGAPELGERRLRPGDEVITAAAGFPTTVAPVVQAGCVPVFVDSDPRTGNLRVDQLEDAFVPGSGISSSSRTTATRSGACTTAGRRAASAICPPRASTRPTT